MEKRGARPPAGPAAGRGGRVPLLGVGRASRSARGCRAGRPSAPDVTVRRCRGRAARPSYDAVVLAGGATLPRDLDVPGARARGVHFAMEYLKPSNLVQEGALAASPIVGRRQARGHHRRRRHRGRLPGHRPPAGGGLGPPARDHARAARATGPSEHPWPVWPVILRTSSAHEEGGRAPVLGHHHRVRRRRVRGRAGPAGPPGGGRPPRAAAPSFTPVAGSEFELPLRPGAAGHGLRRGRAQRRGGRTGGGARPPGLGGRRPATGPPTSRGSSSAAT